MKELAARIKAHLSSFEADPVINADSKGNGKGLRPYWNSSAHYGGGPKLSVMYVSYHGNSMLSKGDATRYLAKLDAGFVGRHYEALKEPA